MRRLTEVNKNGLQERRTLDKGQLFIGQVSDSHRMILLQKKEARLFALKHFLCRQGDSRRPVFPVRTPVYQVLSYLNLLGLEPETSYAAGSSVLGDKLYCFVLRLPDKSDTGGIRRWPSAF